MSGRAFRPDLAFDGPADAALTLALAHGAGAPRDSPFLEAFARGIANRGFRVARFEFPYMAARRTGGPRRPPDPWPVLMQTWRAVVDAIGDAIGHERLAVGGKSLGGRAASVLAAEMEGEGNPPRAVVCLGYPFHPPGKPDAPRTSHLARLATPTLIVQGTRDPFGSQEEVIAYSLSPAVRLHWIEDGDHSFVPRRASGRSEGDNLREGIAAVGDFLAAV